MVLLRDRSKGCGMAPVKAMTVHLRTCQCGILSYLFARSNRSTSMVFLGSLGE